ncbi:MAG: hypothetical protein KAI81_04395 [Candidatus Marinimicrobia bacterium]|nr:hypothetical protein [Candidatus Neomarinimicrobiota bacterium]
MDFKKLLEDKKMKPEKKEERKGGSIEPTDTWINKTQSGKGFMIYVKEDFKKGDMLFGGIEALQEFIDGERNGINLGIMVFEED